ncbi:SIMPL domain-containing protein [Prevotella sp. A2931]|uniref:SIMPL domain-containing protein n=1 Tax=Prevotella illustrans TaxID=2800387 RepID=A0ABS3M8Q2_9BACT|nr:MULTISPECIES: SIMPL domain-containing protein [Prevotella]MBO1364505.1 SIMPL domain-containing protein [Prevotella illustrans]PTL26648.1 SIMPL domain-containing protein [Prevotella sp. oral taxon 820]
MNRTKLLLAAFAGIVIIISAWLLAQGVTNFRKESPKLNVTGMAEKQITSDLIVWNITLKAKGDNRASAYSQYKRVAAIMRKYLKAHGITDPALSTSSVDINQETRQVYNRDSHQYDSYDDGFSVTQTFTVRSNDVPLVERVYQNIAELYNEGIDFSSNAPLYYYTKLNDLKMEMLNKASENAYERAQTIAKGSHSAIGAMLSSAMGVFQIVGLNSEEEYSWGGTFNTSSKEKVASITVRTTYEVEN